MTPEFRPFCGCCAMCASADSTGARICRLYDTKVGVSDRCTLNTANIKHPVTGLRYYQQWRRGADIIALPPYVISVLLDTTIERLGE